MKTMFRTMTVMAMCLGLFACNKNDGLDDFLSTGEGILGTAETYATIRIAMPGGGVESKGVEDGDGELPGVGNENAFNSVALYFFDSEDIASAKCEGVFEMTKEMFTKKDVGSNIVYESDAQKIGIEGEGMKVYAVVNGSVEGVNTGTALEKFIKAVVLKGDVIKKDGGDLASLLMTSRNPGVVDISTANVKDNPATLSVSVERTAARIDYKANNGNKFDVKKNTESSDVVANVTITDYKLVNLRNDAYYFRKVGNDPDNFGEGNGSGDLTGSNYVIDPQFGKKTLEEAGKPNFESEWFGEGKAYAQNVESYTAIPADADYKTLDYCMENTMQQSCQLNGYSTGVIFKAVYAPTQVYALDETGKKFTGVNYEPGTDFYRYSNVLYRSKEEIKKFYNVSDEVIDTYVGNGETGAVCYYKYWMVHFSNGQPNNMGVMEFAIVRNNAYRLDISSVSGLGEPTDKIDPENPDENSEMYLKVNVTIKPWVVRNNSIIL